MSVLVLGGTGEAVSVARRLHAAGRRLIYSLAGAGGVPALACPVRHGGFGGTEGLADYLRRNGITLLVDATHPYAATVSAHAAEAARARGVALWACHRPPWQPPPGARWSSVPDWWVLMQVLKDYRRPLFTVGRSALDWSGYRGDGQRWVVRCLPPVEASEPGVQIIAERGPFSLAGERRLFERWQPDVLVSKNSGGDAVAAKLTVAGERDVPVVMLARPRLPEPDRAFDSPEALCEAAC